MENSAMRSACTAAVRGSAVIEAAVRLVRSGYDGPLTGEAVTPLFHAVAEYERVLAKKGSR